MGRIPQQGQARRRQGLCQLQGQGIDEARTQDLDLTQKVAEPAAQVGLEHLWPGMAQGFGLRGLFGPDQTGPVAGEGQDGKGAGGEGHRRG
jgi:hypothetical protein